MSVVNLAAVSELGSAGRSPRWGWLGAAALGLMVACVTPIKQALAPAAEEHPVTRVAVLPFTFEPFSERDYLTAPQATTATEVVTAAVSDALVEWTEFEMASRHDADALLAGQVRRYHDRQGGPRGSARPASVRFELELRTAEGVVLWQGLYDEAQTSVSQDLRSWNRASERGFRWVTAEDLAAYGARELMRSLGEHRAAFGQERA